MERDIDLYVLHDTFRNYSSKHDIVRAARFASWSVYALSILIHSLSFGQGIANAISTTYYYIISCKLLPYFTGQISPAPMELGEKPSHDGIVVQSQLVYPLLNCIKASVLSNRLWRRHPQRMTSYIFQRYINRGYFLEPTTCHRECRHRACPPTCNDPLLYNHQVKLSESGLWKVSNTADARIPPDQCLWKSKTWDREWSILVVCSNAILGPQNRGMNQQRGWTTRFWVEWLVPLHVFR